MKKQIKYTEDDLIREVQLEHLIERIRLLIKIHNLTKQEKDYLIKQL
jgi:hypothetical protein